MNNSIHHERISEFMQVTMGQSPPSETYNQQRKGLPDLNEKEYVLCQVLASAYHDTDWGNYNYVIDVTTHYYREIFSGQKEVESTIQDLIEKGIIQSTPMEEERELRLKDDVQDELVGSWRIEFASAVMAGIASTNAIF